MTLTSSQIQHYRDLGYLVIERFLSEAQCSELCSDAERVADGHYANILDLHFRSVVFRHYLTDSELLPLADQLQQARMIPIGSIFFFCKPGNPIEQGSAWHQDNYAPKAPYGSYLVCALALDDADADNGALAVVPRSHKLGDLPGKPSKNFEFNASGKITKAYPIGNEVEIPVGYTPLTLSYPRGSAIFLHAHTIHGAERNPSLTRWRRAVYFHYIKDGDPFWPGWNARRQLLERGAAYR